MKRRKKLSDEEFVWLWNREENAFEVAKVLRVNKKTVINRAWRLRRKGWQLTDLR